MRRGAFGKKSGLTLLELLIGVVLLVVTTTATALAGLTSSELFKTGVTRTGTESQVRRALHRLQGALLASGLDTLDPRPTGSLWTSTLTFDGMGGLTDDQGLIEWNPMRVELLLEDGEIDDGLDNNGNGLTDERRLVLIRNPGEANERVVVLSRYVRELFEGEIVNGIDDNGNELIDEAGFCASLQGNTLDLWLTLEVVDEDGLFVTRSLQTSVLLRN